MNFPNQISGIFNKPIQLGSGSLRVYKDDALFLTFTTADIVISGAGFTIDVSNLFPDNGSYFVLFDSGLFKSSTEVYNGISDPSVWTWTISSGSYESASYSSNYLIN